MPAYKALPETKWRKAQSSEGRTPDEVALIMGSEHFSSKKVRRAIRSKELAAHKRFQRWFVTDDDLRKYIAAVEKANS